ALRTDTALAQRLAAFLERDLADPLTASDEKRVIRRMYLCRLIGEFHVPTGLPVLLKAASEERGPIEVQIRLSATEALTTLADHWGVESFQTSDVLNVLLTASRAADESSGPSRTTPTGEPTLYRPHAELRAVAAYALGVIGGDEA